MSIPSPLQLPFAVAFTRIEEIGPIGFKKILQGFPSLENAWHAGIQDFVHIGISHILALKICERKKIIDPEQEWNRVLKENVSVIIYDDSEYPKLLKEISVPPLLLYYRGTVKNLELPLAVVGTRKVSPYGREVTGNIVSVLVQNGFSIISGLALGVDTIAHETALEYRGISWAVLGCGIDQKTIYPPTNRKLAEKIVASGGALISEYPPYTQAYPFHFPQRNRIISALCLGTLVTEAPEKSGALITSHYALEQNREVFAVPGSILNPNAQGTNQLIKMGAHPVTSASDILEAFNIHPTPSATRSNETILTPEQNLILHSVTLEAVHIDSIIQTTGLPSQKVISALTYFELQGIVKYLGNGMYRKLL